MIRAGDKIAVAYFLYRFQRGGGTENQLFKLIENIDRTRFEPIVFNLWARSDDQPDNMPCPVYYLNLSSLLRPSLPVVIARSRALLKRHRVRIAQVYFFESRFVGTLAARWAGVPRVVFCRREMGWWYQEGDLKLKVLRWLARKADHCLVNAEAIKKMVSSDERFPSERIKVIYNGVESRPGGGDPATLRSELSLPADAPVIGIVANLRLVKRIDHFIDVAAKVRHPNTHFLIIGRGGLKPQLQQQAQARGIGDRVRFHYTTTGVADLLNLCSVGVLTSESEGLPNVLVEYGQAGLPGVAFDVGGNPEVVLDGQTGFILEYGDVDGMAARIDELLDKPELRTKMGTAARERCMSVFSVQKMVEETEAFYERILADEPSR